MTVTRRLEKEILKQSPTGIGKTDSEGPREMKIFKKTVIFCPITMLTSNERR